MIGERPAATPIPKAGVYWIRICVAGSDVPFCPDWTKATFGEWKIAYVYDDGRYWSVDKNIELEVGAQSWDDYWVVVIEVRPVSLPNALRPGVYRKVDGRTGVGLLYQFLLLAREHTSGNESVVYIPLRVEPEWAGTVRPCYLARAEFERKFVFVGEGLPADSEAR